MNISTLCLLATLIYEHQYSALINFGEKIALEDKSEWHVAGPDVYKIVSWGTNDTVILTPNHSWFSFYKFDYYLTNTTQNSYARVSLATPSEFYGLKSHWVSSIDKFGGFIFLENGASWKVCPADKEALQDWSLNDHVIYGYNDEWIASYEYLLINTHLKKHVRVSAVDAK
jgi:hypothetical protein